MKTKFGILFLALVLIIGGFAACAEEPPTPEERAYAAWTHYLELTGAFHGDAVGAWAADFTMDMEIDISIMTIRTVSTGHMAQIQTDEENMQMLMDMTMDMGMFGGEMAMLMYLNMTDGNISMRMIMDGYEMPEEFIDTEMMNEMTTNMEGNLPEFDLYDIIAVEIEEEGDYTTFHFLLDATTLNDFMQETIDTQLGDMLELLGEGAAFHFELAEDMALSLRVYGSDDNPVALTMDMGLRMFFEGDIFEEMAGEEMILRMSTEYIYTAFGDDVVIQTPAPGRPMPEAIPGLFDILADNEDFLSDFADILEDWDLDDLLGLADALGLDSLFALPAGMDGLLALTEELFGSWDWDQDSDYTYTFNPDGTGTRGWPGQLQAFEWGTADDYLFIGAEHWAFTIADGVLTIDSQQVPGMTFRYIAQ